MDFFSQNICMIRLIKPIPIMLIILTKLITTYKDLYKRQKASLIFRFTVEPS